MEGDVEYLRRRAQQEQEAAMNAAHPLARDAHLQMARRFEEFAVAAAVRDKHLGIDLLDG